MIDLMIIAFEWLAHFFICQKVGIFFYLLCQLDWMWWTKFKRLMNWIYKDKDTILTILMIKHPKYPEKVSYKRISLKIVFNDPDQNIENSPAVPIILQSPIYFILISFSEHNQFYSCHNWDYLRFNNQL